MSFAASEEPRVRPAGADASIRLHLGDIVGDAECARLLVNNFSGSNGSITAAFAAAPSGDHDLRHDPA